MARPEVKAFSMRHRRRIDAIPVFGDFLLRLLERQAARANLYVKVISHLVLGMRSAVGNGSLVWLGPEIFWIGGISAQLERNKMILFIVLHRGIGIVVFADLVHFQMIRVGGFGPNRFGAPPGIADRLRDVVLRDVGIGSARRTFWIGINIRRSHMRGNRLSGTGRFPGRKIRARQPDRAPR